MKTRTWVKDETISRNNVLIHLVLWLHLLYHILHFLVLMRLNLVGFPERGRQRIKERKRHLAVSPRRKKWFFCSVEEFDPLFLYFFLFSTRPLFLSGWAELCLRNVCQWSLNGLSTPPLAKFNPLTSCLAALAFIFLLLKRSDSSDYLAVWPWRWCFAAENQQRSAMSERGKAWNCMYSNLQVTAAMKSLWHTVMWPCVEESRCFFSL